MIDFHTHTTASDGVLSPSEVVAEAARAGLSAVGITDHDTVGGIADAKRAADFHGISLIPGVELTAYHESREWHVLAVLIDAPPAEIAGRLQPFIEKRRERMAEMVARLTRDGYDVSFDEVEAEAAGDIIGRMHLAVVLIAKGYARSNNEVYRSFIGNDAPYCVPKLPFSVPEAVQLAYELGGIPVLAHPSVPGDDDAIPGFVEAGLAGIEAHTPKHTYAQEKHYAEIGRSLGLVTVAGSDFHGRGKHDRVGQRTASDEVLDALRELKERRLSKLRGG